MSTLTELANRYDSDKGTTGGRTPHRYTYLYDLLFYPLKDAPISFLEIGLCRGGPELGGAIDRKGDSPSVRMWKDYFPNAWITGFDISDFSHQMDDRFLFIRGDSGKREDMERLSVARTHYDVIIEDASHASYHQQMALLTLWDKLTPGGLFIIEDTNWQPPVFEESMPAVPKTTDFLRSLFEQGTYMENDLLSQSFSEHLRDTTQCASFFPTFEEGGRTRVKIIVLLKTK